VALVVLEVGLPDMTGYEVCRADRGDGDRRRGESEERRAAVRGRKRRGDGGERSNQCGLASTRSSLGE
jgi:CheY-like chemotaxis protein